MEKLRPVIKQLFWISTGFVVLIAVGGWWMAMGSLNKSIEDGRKTLEKNVKSSKAGKEAPNDAWAANAAKMNDAYRAEFSAAELQLHRSQKSTRRFPDGPAGAELARIEFLTRIDDRPLRARYKEIYLDHFLEQIRVLNPFIVEDNQGLIVVEPSGIQQADTGAWVGREPTSSEIWTAQEDLWLLRSLFESIANVNEGSTRLGTSPVREMKMLRLRGGSRKGGGAAAAAAFGPEGAFGGMIGLGGLSAGAIERRDMDTDKKSKSGGNTPNPGLAFAGGFTSDFLSEEFGPPPSKGGGTGGGSRGGGRRGRDEEEEANNWSWGDETEPAPKPEPAPSTSPTPAGGNEIESEMKARYVDDTAEYRTRAFLLDVRVTQDAVPSLLAELTNSSFPVEIVRVSARFSSGDGSEPGLINNNTGRGRAESADEDGGGFRFGGGRGGGLGGRGLGSRGLGRRGLSFQRPGRGGDDRDSPRRRGGGGGGANSSGLLSRLSVLEYSPERAAKGEEQRFIALADTTLVELRIGGLLTLYRTKEENLNAEKTEELDVLETEDKADAGNETETGMSPDTAAAVQPDGESVESTSEGGESQGNQNAVGEDPESNGT